MGLLNVDPENFKKLASQLGIGDTETELRKDYVGASKRIFEEVEHKVPSDFLGLYYDVGQRHSSISTNALLAILAKGAGSEGTAKLIEAALDRRSGVLKYSLAGMASYALMKFVLDADMNAATQVVNDVKEVYFDREEWRRYTFKESIRDSMEDNTDVRFIVSACAAVVGDNGFYEKVVGDYVDLANGKLLDTYSSLPLESKALLGVSLYIARKPGLGDAIAKEVKEILESKKGSKDDASTSVEPNSVFRNCAIGILFAARGRAIKLAKNGTGD